MQDKRKMNLLRNFLMVLFIVFLFTGSLGAAVISSDFQEKLTALAHDDMVRVIISMEDRPEVFKAMGTQAVKDTLQHSALSAQAPICNILAGKVMSGQVKAYKSFWIVNVVFAEVQRDFVFELAKLPGVKEIYEDYEFTIDIPEINLPGANQQTWDHVGATFAPELWELGIFGQGITVAVIDTGVDVEHPEFEGAMGGVPPYHEGYWAEFDAEGGMVEGSIPHDTHYHGTHVSGTVLARNVKGIKIGVAPQATLAHACAIPGGSGTFPQVLGALEWVVENNFDIASGSFGANGYHPDQAQAVDNMVAAGIFPVFAIGNDPGTTGAPGNAPAALGVGAFKPDGSQSEFSGGGFVEYPGYEYDELTRIKPDISAPGSDIYSTFPDGGYESISGTSMATPHVSGIVALLLSRAPDLPVETMRELLFSTTGGHEGEFGWEDITAKNIKFGWGRINAFKAFKELPFPGPKATVRGTVSGTETGDSIAGAVLTFNGLQPYTFNTDEIGYYEGEVVEGLYQINVTADGYNPVSQEVLIIAGRDNVKDFGLRSVPKGSVTGLIYDQGLGTLLADAQIRVFAGEMQNFVGEVLTDGEGSYSMELAEGDYTIHIGKAGYFTEIFEDIRIISRQDTNINTNLVFGFQSIQGDVMDDAGWMLDDVNITVLGTEDETTSYEGTFALDLAPGNYTLRFEKPGFLAKTIDCQVRYGLSTRLSVILDQVTGHLQGNISNLEGEAISMVSVSIPYLGLETVTDNNGDYHFADVGVGQWSMFACHENYWEQQTIVTVEEGDTAVENLLLEYRGTVLFQNNFDTVDEWGAWEVAGGPDPWFRTDTRSFSAPYSVWSARPSGYVSKNTRMKTINPVALPAGGNNVLEFMLWSQMSGGGWDNLSVDVIIADTGIPYRVFSHDGRDAEWLKVSIALDSFAGKEVYLEFGFFARSGSSMQGAFIDNVSISNIVSPSPQQGMISGAVTDWEGNSLNEVIVSLVEITPTLASGALRNIQYITGPDGTFTLDVPGGGWAVKAEKAPDYMSAVSTVYVAPGTTQNIGFCLEPNEAPAQVSGLRVVKVGHGYVDLAWDHNTDEDLAGYFIYRSVDNVHYHEIGYCEENSFRAEYLQNDLTYYFKITAMDQLGKESQPSQAVQAVPSAEVPVIRAFDVKPRALQVGGNYTVSANLENPVDTNDLLDVTIEATQGNKLMREWVYDGQAQGEFSVTIPAKDILAINWQPGIYQFTLYAKNSLGLVTSSNTINVALLAPLPQALSFVFTNNPFTPTDIPQQFEYTVPSQGHIDISVYTLDDKPVKTLVNKYMEAGQYMGSWDGRDNLNKYVLGGLYLVKISFTDDSGQRVELIRHSVVIK